MAIFDKIELKETEKRLLSQIDIMPDGMDEETLTDFMDSIDTKVAGFDQTGSQSTGVSSSLSGQVRTDIWAKGLAGEVAAMRSFNNDPSQMDDGYVPPETELSGSNINELTIINPERNVQARRDFTYRYMQQMSADHAIGQAVDRFLNRDLPDMSPEEANTYAKSMGADIKFNKPVSSFEVKQSVDTYIRRKNLEQAISGLNSTGSYGFLSDASILASGLAGSIGPLELTASVTLGALIPELAVAGIAKGGQIAQQMLKLKKTADAAKAIRTAKTMNMISKGAVAPVGSEAHTAVSVILKNSEAGIKAAKIEERNIKAAQALEKIQGLKYDRLTNLEKTGLDTLAFLGADVPFINITRDNSRELGWDLYSEKDKAMDTLLASGLGIFLPAGLRQIGRVLGISPSGLLLRKLDNIETDINAKEALGDITAEQAEEARKAVGLLRKDPQDMKNVYKQPDPFFEKMATDLQMMNVSNETLMAQKAYILGQLKNGNRPKIHLIPQFESIMSHVDATMLRRLTTENAQQVFGNALFREVSANGSYRVRVQGDTGLLGARSITALSEEESLEQLQNMYKGLVLRDPKALLSFRQWVQRYTEFNQDLGNIYATYQDQLRQNRRAKRAGMERRSSTALINVRTSMREAYLKYRLGDQGAALSESVSQRQMNDALGNRMDPLAPDQEQVLADFEEWYSGFISEKRDKAGNLLFDFVDSSGKNDYGKRFEGYLDELREGADNNTLLAASDDVISTWAQADVENIVRQSIELDVSPDTNMDNLFGVPRQDLEGLRHSAREASAWRAQLAERTVDWNKFQYGPEYQEARRILERQGSSSPEAPSGFKMAISTIDDVRAFRETGFTDIKENIISEIKNTPAFQKKLIDLINGSNVRKGIELMYRDIVSKALAKSPIAERIGRIRDIVDDAVEVFRRTLDEHPENMEALVNPQDMEAMSKFPEFGATENRIGLSARNMVTMDALLSPIDTGLDIALSRLELQAINDAEIYMDKMSLMLANPEAAAEIITGAATQSVYVFEGAHRSIESLKRTAGFYTNDIKNQLRAMEASTESGQTLLDYYSKPSNKDEIVTAIINQKHGITGLNNSDAERIAKVILDQEASFLASFRRFGSSYTNPSNVIQKAKLRYADSMIQDSEITEFYDSALTAMSLNAEDLISTLPRVNNAGEVRVGTEIRLPDAKLVKRVDKAIQEMHGTINDLVNIGDPSYCKMAAWAFRDFDLDQMFNADNSSLISLNKVRDALINNDLASVIDGDVQNIFHINASLKRIKTALIGPRPERTEIGIIPDTPGWVYKYRNGFNDIGAVMTGEKAASLDAFEGGIHFKDAESEINAARLFGYDKLEEHVQKSFDNMFQAYYALENFGTRPVAMAEELIDTYNRARVNDPNFSRKLKEYAGKRGKNPRPTEKFAITQSGKQSVIENVLLACGLQNSSPSAVTRFLKATMSFLSTSLLVKAGLKSLSDHSTIWEGLITNGFVEGRPQAMATAGKAMQQLVENRDILHLVLGTTVLQQDEVFKKMSNDPGADIIKVSANAHFIDKYEQAARKYADFMMNDFAQLGRVTNGNKYVAGWAIQMAIGANANKSYDELGKFMQYALLRDSITKDDWNFIRINLVRDLNEYISTRYGREMKGESYNMLIPLSIRDLPDNVFAEELARRGELNVTPSRIYDFKNSIASKVWNMIDGSSDEMVSIPSGRVANNLRGGRARNSGIGTVWEIATQFQSFGAAMLYNTYGRKLANFVAEETGVSVIDLFNPSVKLANHNRLTIFGSLFGSFFLFFMTMLIIDSAVNALSGNIQKPIGPDGKVHADSILSASLGALGTGGVVLDAALEGIEGSGQRGGGFAMQVAPSLSNLVRTGYRVTQPLRSSRVPDAMKPEAFAAAVAQEVARFTGLRSAPIISLVYQDLVGAWLDSRIKGGYAPYDTYIDNRERRGMVVMPWERNPEPVWEQLQLSQ